MLELIGRRDVLAGVIAGTGFVVAPVALLLSTIIVFAYRSQIARLMRSAADVPSEEAVDGWARQSTAARSEGASLHAAAFTARRCERRLLIAEVVSGVLFSVAATGCWFACTGASPRRPIMVVLALAVFSAPLPLTIIATRSRRLRHLCAASMIHVGCLALVGAAAGDLGPALLLWYAWSAGPTLLVLAFSVRRVRAVGPFALVAGWLLVNAAGLGAVSSALWGMAELDMHFTAPAYTHLPAQEALRGCLARSSCLALLTPLLDHPSLAALVTVGAPQRAGVGFMCQLFARSLWPVSCAAMAAWAMLKWQASRLRKRRSSDLQLSAQTIWAVFTLSFIASGIGTARPWLSVAGFGAGFAFTVVTGPRIIAMLAGKERTPPTALLLLRTFGSDRRTQELVDSVTRRWRALGPAYLVGAPDAAYATLRACDFYDFIAGRLARRFIGSLADFTRVHSPARRDPDGLYRVETYYCFRNGWQGAVNLLMEESAAVLMDLRGFDNEHHGCIEELGMLVDRGERAHAVLLFDKHTDRLLVDSTIASALRRLYERTGTMPTLTIHTVNEARTMAQTIADLYAALLARTDSETALPHDAARAHAGGV